MKKKLKYYGGSGFLNVPENGIFIVDSKDKKTFNKLSEAIKYYKSINDEKAIWDITNTPELLECHTL